MQVSYPETDGPNLGKPTAVGLACSACRPLQHIAQARVSRGGAEEGEPADQISEHDSMPVGQFSPAICACLSGPSPLGS